MNFAITHGLLTVHRMVKMHHACPRPTAAYRELFEYDPWTMALRWLVNKGRIKAGSVAGTVHRTKSLRLSRGKQVYYVRVRSNGKREYAHNIIWALITGAKPPKGFTVDHIDRNGLNNALWNLRLADPRQQKGNVGLRVNNTSGRIGVSWNSARNCWEAYIKRDDVKLHLGLYLDLDDAARDHDRAAIEHFGEEHALTNAKLGLIGKPWTRPAPKLKSSPSTLSNEPATPVKEPVYA